MSDLIERARAAAQHSREFGPGTNAPLLDELADALEAARRAVAIATGERNRVQAKWDKCRINLRAAREDAERWRHARKLLTIDDIEGAQGAYDSFGGLISEDECVRADAAIDAAREARNG